MSRWLAALLAALVLAACQAERRTTPVASPAPQVQIGATAHFDDVPYIAFAQVSLERLPRERLEAAGEARIDGLARRVPAYRLKGQPAAAVRYTVDGTHGWLAWQPQAVLHARRELARAANINPSRIQTLDVTSEVWPDSCLGVATPGQACTPEPVPGFRVLLRVDGRTLEYRTDQFNRVVPAQR
jgi:hypothetical protein